ncbi:hypothetical protein F2P56_004663, partial [Juglans regia]
RESSKGKGIRMVAGAYYIPKKDQALQLIKARMPTSSVKKKKPLVWPMGWVAGSSRAWTPENMPCSSWITLEAILSMEPDDGNVDDRILKRVLDQAFSNTKAKGSSTACIIKLIDNIFTIEVESGDILVVGTVGLFDNVFDKEIRDVVKMAVEVGCNPRQVAWAVAEHAYDKSMNRTAYTPFMQASLASGRRFLVGKVDDITVIVVNIVDA